ncbi:hypothetical protein CGGC5_v013066 [Colletotrichum fructicola Nara gc5]|uniref:Uncharacterized protein n=1 Tax=Colletotrichum fructicola (strain Nara gc5) TaxID=1213859 RepID=A0A7J6IKP0_COLFN|nr:hypothetical protein CGGC5_v013066 [Colletotrichum fructicola Nara gc5]
MSRRQISPALRAAHPPYTPDSLLEPTTGRRFRSQIACMDFSNNDIPLDAQPSSPPGAAVNTRPQAPAPGSVGLAPSDVSVADPITQQDQPASPLVAASAPADRNDAAAAGLYQCPHCQRREMKPSIGCSTVPSPLRTNNNNSSYAAHQELAPPQQPACLSTAASGLETLRERTEAENGRPATLTTWRAGLVPDPAHVIHEISAYRWFATTSPISTTTGRGVYAPETGSVTGPEPGSQPVLDFYAGSSLGLYVVSSGPFEPFEPFAPFEPPGPIEPFELFKQPSLGGTNTADSRRWPWPADDAVETIQHATGSRRGP